MPLRCQSRGRRIKASKNGNGKDFSFPGRPEVWLLTVDSLRNFFVMPTAEMIGVIRRLRDIVL
jgi:hypothetical protein